MHLNGKAYINFFTKILLQWVFMFLDPNIVFPRYLAWFFSIDSSWTLTIMFGFLFFFLDSKLSETFKLYTMFFCMTSLLHKQQDNDFIQPFKVNECLIYTSRVDLLIIIMNIISWVPASASCFTWTIAKPHRNWKVNIFCSHLPI